MKRHLTLLGAAIFMVGPGGFVPSSNEASSYRTEGRIIEIFPDGVWVRRARDHAAIAAFERDGQDLVQVTITPEALKTGSYAVKACGPDKLGGERIVVRIPSRRDLQPNSFNAPNLDLCTGELLIPAPAKGQNKL